MSFGMHVIIWHVFGFVGGVCRKKTLFDFIFFERIPVA